MQFEIENLKPSQFFLVLLVSKEYVLKENAALPDKCFYWLPSENDR